LIILIIMSCSRSDINTIENKKSRSWAIDGYWYIENPTQTQGYLVNKMAIDKIETENSEITINLDSQLRTVVGGKMKVIFKNGSVFDWENGLISCNDPKCIISIIGGPLVPLEYNKW